MATINLRDFYPFYTHDYFVQYFIHYIKTIIHNILRTNENSYDIVLRKIL